MGLRAQFVDMNVDGVMDVVGMGRILKHPLTYQWWWSGNLFWYPGGVPATAPDREISGDVNGDRFGRGFASLVTLRVMVMRNWRYGFQ